MQAQPFRAYTGITKLAAGITQKNALVRHLQKSKDHHHLDLALGFSGRSLDPADFDVFESMR